MDLVKCLCSYESLSLSARASEHVRTSNRKVVYSTPNSEHSEFGRVFPGHHRKHIGTVEGATRLEHA